MSLQRSIKHQLNLVWEVYPIQTEVTYSSNELKYYLAKEATDRGLVSADDQVLIIGGSLLDLPASTNYIQTMKIEDILRYGQQLQKSVK
ncbi:MAG: pyruvate kinase alpha/beta domain-containing protein [Candidatus Hodarchaeales archaeon]